MNTTASGTVFTVTDSDARIRTPPPEANWNGKRIPTSTRVRVLAQESSYSKVVGLNGNEFGWTATSNLTRFFKDYEEFESLTLAPSKAIELQRSWGTKRRAMAKTYNRIGGGLKTLAKVTKIEIAACLAVWYVESAGREHKPGEAIIRFENHHLFRYWGDKNPELYDQHFQHGGRRGVAGKSWENHRWRERTSEDFGKFHGNQTKEYRVLRFAEGLAGNAVARKCISIGGTQILCSNSKAIGYASVNAMYNAFQESEMAQVIGFFDFCHSKGLVKPLRNRHWVIFAAGYNGSGQANQYGEKIDKAYVEAGALFS